MYSVSVHVGCGSRHETLDTTGVNHVLRNMLTRGTSAQSKASIADEIESMGARIDGESGREQSRMTMQVFKGDIARAVSLLGDAYSNANLDAAELELAKEQIAAEHEENYRDYHYHTLENCHFNSYRDHMMGQPIKGDRDHVANINVDML